MINHYFGGTMVKIKNHVSIRHDIFIGKETLNVNSYHGFGIHKEGLADCLEIVAEDKNGFVEGKIEKGKQILVAESKGIWFIKR